MNPTYGTVRYEKQNDQWVMSTQPQVTMRLKRIFPRISQSTMGDLRIKSSQEVCNELRWVFTKWPLEISAADQRFLDENADLHDQRVENVRNVLDNGASAVPYQLEPSTEMTPRVYQETAHRLISQTGTLLLADELGLGKTLSSLLSATNPEMRPVLVVTLAGTMPRQWVRETHKIFPSLLAVEPKKGTPYDLTVDGRSPDVIVLNYAKLAGWADHLAGWAKTVIYDEVQDLRHLTTKKHAAARMISAQASHRWALSATPVYNNGGEIYSVYEALNPGILGSADEFGREWCGTGGGLDTKTKVRDSAGLRAYLQDSGVFLRRYRDDPDVGLEFPDVTCVDQSVDTDRQKLDDATGNAAEMARLILGLTEQTEKGQRFTAAGTFESAMRQATGIAKAPFVAEFVRVLLESEEKVILLGWHRAVWELWKERLAEFKPVLYTGSESPAQKARSFDEFRDGDARILMMSLRSGAGLDGLQDVASTLVFGELDWAPGVHKQAIGRLHRPGQAKPVVAYFCKSDEGADPFMSEVLDVKAIQADMLMNPENDDLILDVDTSDVVARMAAQALGVKWEPSAIPAKSELIAVSDSDDSVDATPQTQMELL